MAVAPEILDVVEGLQPEPFDRRIFRHMFAGKPPSIENRSGARWNPPDLPAIYTSLERATALAEADYRLSFEPVPLRPDLRRTLYEIEVILKNVIDLREEVVLKEIGLGPAELAGLSLAACQEVGYAVAFLGHGGLLVPSARAKGSNLVIYPRSMNPGRFEIVGQEDLTGWLPPSAS